MVLNTSNEPRDARIWIVKFDGTVLSTYAHSGFNAIQPGQARGLSFTPATFLNTTAYCKVQAEGLKAEWRGAFSIKSLYNGSYDTRVSIPLQ
jgi:hypothetical protein